VRQYLVVLEPDESGGYIADVPALPGCVTHGDTVDDALVMAREAVGLYLRDEDADSLAGAGVRDDIIFATVAVPASA
jgi:predicted RNase H-like HicB family nuclease